MRVTPLGQMPRRLAPEPLDLAQVFKKAQGKMKSDLGVDRLFAHAPTAGAASEQQWLTVLEAYLPKRYRAAPAFIVNVEGKCSRQIDVAIYDSMQSPPLFPHASGIHLPIESVYAVFEVKTQISQASILAGKRSPTLLIPRESGMVSRFLVRDRTLNRDTAGVDTVPCWSGSYVTTT